VCLPRGDEIVTPEDVVTRDRFLLPACLGVLYVVWRSTYLAQRVAVNVRLLAFDAASPRGERRYARRHLRNMIRSHLRALEARLAAIEPRAVEAPPAIG